MSSLNIALEFLFFVFSTILEAIEDVYLFIESHFERQRDFEKIDDLVVVSYRHALTEGSCHLQTSLARTFLWC